METFLLLIEESIYLHLMAVATIFLEQDYAVCVRLCMFMVKCDVPSKLISKKEKEERKPCPILTLSQLVVRIPRSSPSDCTSIHPRAEVPHTPS